MNYDAVPLELRQRDQWVTWRYIDDPKHPDKPKKMPFNPHTGKAADSTNSQTWASFDLAVRAAHQRKHAGIGYVFTNDDPFFGGDLDDCIEHDQLAPWAKQILDEMQTYTEISPSGHGVKFFGIGNLPENIKRFGDKIPPTIKPSDIPGGIELYATARYFTVTGRHLPGTPTELRSVNGALARLIAALAPVSHTAEPTARATVDDGYLHQWAERIIERAEETLRLAPDGSLHDTRIDMGRLCGGLIPHGLATADALAERLYAARMPSAHHTTERKAIRDGLAMGEVKPLALPEPPPQPLFDSEGYAVCPVHGVRLPSAKNSNGYKCHQKDESTASGWCDFWWKGKGYIPPRTQETAEPVIIAGEIISQSPATAARAARYVLYKLSGLRELPPIEWLFENEIPAGLTTIICGASGAGKSFLTLDYAIRIARAFPDRLVVYIAPEGGSGYRARIEAWLTHFGGDEPDNLAFILQAIPFLDQQAVSDLVTTIRPLRPVMIVVDTLARCLIGGDENSARDIGVFFYHTDMIRQETGAAVAIVHHTGKSGAFRGSSALYGSVESWIDVTNDDGLITVACGKSKDSKPFAPRYLRMVESAESVVLLPSDQVSQRNGELTEPQRKTLETLALDIFTGPGAKRSELVSATGIPEPTMYKVLSRLKRNGYVSQGKRGDPYYITDYGMSAIRSYHRDLRQQREKLSNYPETINELSDSNALPTINYHQLSPLKGGDSSDSLVESPVADSSSDDLFAEDPTPTDTPTSTQASPTAPALGARRERQPDWDYLRKMFDAKNWVGFQTHCQLSGITADAAVAQIEAERGIQDDESEVF